MALACMVGAEIWVKAILVSRLYLEVITTHGEFRIRT
jgi:hypothetical protein